MDHITQPPSGPQGADSDSLCIREPEDLLSFIPHTMGEWPSESLVVLTIGAGTVGVTVRVDLPPVVGGTGDLEAYAEAICDHLQSDVLAEGTVLVIYTAEPWTVVGSPPRMDVVGKLQGVLAEAGLPVLDAWLVGDRHWRSLLCDRSSCCPWPGKPLDSIATSCLGAELIFRGSTFESPQGSSHGSVGHDGEGDSAEPSSEAAVRALLARLRDDPGAWWRPSFVGAALAAWDDTLGSDHAPSPERLGLLAATLIRPAIRDAVMVSAAIGGAAAWRGSIALGVLEHRWDNGASGRSTMCEPYESLEVRFDEASVRSRSVAPTTDKISHEIVAGTMPALPGGLRPEDVEQRVDAWLGDDDLPSTAGLVVEEACLAEAETAASKSLEKQEEAATKFGAVLLGSTVQAPNWGRIARLERVARSMTEFEDPEVRAPALALLAWICWARGRGSKAAGYLRRALSVHAGYRFALLFARLIDSGQIAEWAKRPETAWRRLDDVA